MADMKTLTINGTTYNVVDEVARSTANAALPLAGGTMTGDLHISKSGRLASLKHDGTAAILLNYNAGASTWSQVIVNNNHANKANELVLQNNTATYNVLHTGNTKTETWTFTLEDGTTVTKAVYVG